MKADPFVQLRLLELQAVDTRLDQLAHRRRTLPEAATVTEIDERAARVRDLLVAAETVASDLQRELDRAERDVVTVRERIAKDRALMDSGTVGNAKQLESIQHEVESLARRQSDLEDAELEVMERVDGAQAAVATLAVERDELAAARESAVVARDSAYAEIDSQAADAQADRALLLGDFPADLLALYEKLRADNGGVGAAPLHRGACQGCRLELTASDLQRIRDASSDEVVRCEECRRILVRAADSGL